MVKALGADNVVTTEGDLGVCPGCVVRVEPIEQDLTTSRWTSLAKGCDLGIPYERYLWRVHVR